MKSLESVWEVDLLLEAKLGTRWARFMSRPLYPCRNFRIVLDRSIEGKISLL